MGAHRKIRSGPARQAPRWRSSRFLAGCACLAAFWRRSIGPRHATVPPVAEPLIRFRDVRKAFGNKVIYRGLNLDIHAGETITIMGGSGVGKSVMLKLLIRLLDADHGSITFHGEEVSKM